MKRFTNLYKKSQCFILIEFHTHGKKLYLKYTFLTGLSSHENNFLRSFSLEFFYLAGIALEHESS